jgi:hypothetical protein
MRYCGGSRVKGRLMLQILFALLISAAAQAQEDNTIYWTEGAKLQFADFKGSKNERGYDAKTTSTIVPKIAFGDDSFYYKIDCVFKKDKSVIKGRNRLTLEHEQGHFDITEICARQIRQRLSTLSAKTGITDAVYKVVEATYDESDRLQQAYEADTGYDYVAWKQEAWNKRIKDMLDALKQYDKAEGTVTLD